jgi:hypothetical protein
VSADLLSAALTWHAAGASVVPTRNDGTKAPVVSWKTYQSTRADEQQIRSWFSSDTHDGLGTITGTVSGGLEMLEVEGRAIALAIELGELLTGHGYGSLWARINNGYVEGTPGGGVHWYYRVDGQPRGNTKLARRPATPDELAANPGERIKVLLETRGEGGFSIVAPSNGRTHPTGRPWTTFRGTPAGIPTITEAERDALHAIAAMLDQTPTVGPQPTSSGAGRTDSGKRPGDDYNERASWDDLLTPRGWTKSKRFGENAYGWTRPGKEARNGISATTNTRDGADRLYVFSTATEFETERPYSKFAAYTLLEHRGDYAAAARALAADGYGEPSQRRGDFSDIVESNCSPAGTAESDAEPIPLVTARTALPFPTSALPTALAQMVTAVAEATQTDPAMAGTTALTMLAAAACGHAEIEVRAGWREPLTLMTATVAKPGERKSAVQAVMSAPLIAAEHELVTQSTGQILQLDTLRAVAQKASDQARDKAGRADKDNRDELIAEAVSAASLAAGMEVPALPRLLADDVTVEAVGSLLAAQGGRLAIVSSEGGVFDILAGRYSPVPSLDVFLKGHSGDPLRVDRRGRPPEYVRRPALTVGVMLQPTVLASIGNNRLFRGRGLLARFLYAVPPSRVGSRTIGASAVPAAVETAYNAAIEALATQLAPWTDPAILTLTPEASGTVLDIERTVEPMLRNDGDLGQIADWGAKLVGAILRIAGLLHLGTLGADDGIRTPVTEATLRDAQLLGDYYRAQAVRAFGEMNTDPATADAIYLLDRVKSTGQEEVSVRDLMRVAQRFRTRAAIADPIQRLVDTGWLIPIENTPTTGPGRPASPEYRVHPSAHLEG